MRDEAVNLTLVFAVYLIEQVEAQNCLADHDLIAVLEPFVPYTAAVVKRAVPRVEVRQEVINRIRSVIVDGRDASVLARYLRVIYTNIRLERTAQNDVAALQRDRNRDKLTAQKNERWLEITADDGCVVHMHRERDLREVAAINRITYLVEQFLLFSITIRRTSSAVFTTTSARSTIHQRPEPKTYFVQKVGQCSRNLSQLSHFVGKFTCLFG